MRRFSSMGSGCGRWKEGTVQYLWFVEITGKGCWNKTLAHLLPAPNHRRHPSSAHLLPGVRSRNSLLSTMRYSLLCTMRLCVILSFLQCAILSFVQCVHVLLSPLYNAMRSISGDEHLRRPVYIALHFLTYFFSVCQNTSLYLCTSLYSATCQPPHRTLQLSNRPTSAVAQTIRVVQRVRVASGEWKGRLKI